jgi:hypothetical protein
VNKSSPLFLFHRPSFIFRHGENSIIPFQNESATIYFSCIGDTLLSLDEAPFGSFIFEREANSKGIFSIFQEIQSWSRSNNFTHVIIRSFPEIYSPDQSSLIKSVLLECGFTIKYEDITQVVILSPGSKINLNTHKKRRLRKARSLEFNFRQVAVDFLEESYALISESRKNKGYPITLTLQELEAMFGLFPEDYLLFGIFDKTKMIAASVCIRINSQILYSFYVGDHHAYRPYSPITLLISEIYNFCGIHHISLLDLGLSTDRGVMNKGLYTFKKSFGTIDSFKLTFEKTI